MFPAVTSRLVLWPPQKPSYTFRNSSSSMSTLTIQASANRLPWFLWTLSLPCTLCTRMGVWPKMRTLFQSSRVRCWCHLAHAIFAGQCAYFSIMPMYFTLKILRIFLTVLLDTLTLQSHSRLCCRLLTVLLQFLSILMAMLLSSATEVFLSWPDLDRSFSASACRNLFFILEMVGLR